MPKLLILAPTFFPDPAVSGIRVTQWAKYLPEFGWTPLVLCRHYAHTASAEALAEKVHAAVQVEYLGPRTNAEGAGNKPASGKARFKHWVAKNIVDRLAVPDPLVWKWKSMRRQAVEVARRWQPDVVLSSSPPHSIHWLGREIARELRIPWAADFRDPYLIDSRYGVHGARKLLASRHRAFEEGIYRDAALCLHAIPLHGRWASRQYAFARAKIQIVPNGMPPEMLEGGLGAGGWGLGEGVRSPRASIRAAGVLGPGAVALIAGAMKKLCDSGVDAEFRHVGNARDDTAGVPVELRDRLKFLGPVSHAEALREIVGADVLFNYLDRERALVGGLSSKLFEYLAVGKPIVAVNPTRADRHLLRGIPWCWSLTEPQPAALAVAFGEAIATDKKPDGPWLQAFRERYNRRNQTERIAGWLNEIAGRNARR